MVPKVANPKNVEDYRPISIIPKLVSKLLANILRTKLPALVDIRQMTSVQGRHPSDNFLVTRELLHNIQRSEHKVVFLKLDFSKAFASVDWKFLLGVLEA
jgi:Reverse transcriptase (RNA-dependent DNA polymerase)